MNYAELKALEAKATPRPWTNDNGENVEAPRLADKDVE